MAAVAARPRGPRGSMMRYGIAFALVVLGAALAVFGTTQLQQADPYGRMGGLLALILAFGCGVTMLFVLAGAKNRVVSVVATAVLVALFVADLAMKCSDGAIPFCR
jgi:peptidoglycan/LPS O-acetylase OafA/YrhL